MDPIRITAGPFRFTARFEAAAAPKTCARSRLLPYRERIIHVRWSGEACWIPLGDLDLGLGYENHTSYPAPGQILLYPGGISETEILLAYGGVQFASKMGQLAGNHFLTVIGATRTSRPRQAGAVGGRAGHRVRLTKKTSPASRERSRRAAARVRVIGWPRTILIRSATGTVRAGRGSASFSQRSGKRGKDSQESEARILRKARQGFTKRLVPPRPRRATVRELPSCKSYMPAPYSDSSSAPWRALPVSWPATHSFPSIALGKVVGRAFTGHDTGSACHGAGKSVFWSVGIRCALAWTL